MMNCDYFLAPIALRGEKAFIVEVAFIASTILSMFGQPKIFESLQYPILKGTGNDVLKD